MKKLIARLGKTIVWQAIRSGLVLAFFMYLMLRIIFYEFQMSWPEEVVFFSKVMLVGASFIALCTSGIIFMYYGILRMKRNMAD